MASDSRLPSYFSNDSALEEPKIIRSKIPSNRFDNFDDEDDYDDDENDLSDVDSRDILNRNVQKKIGYRMSAYRELSNDSLSALASGQSDSQTINRQNGVDGFVGIQRQNGEKDSKRPDVSSRLKADNMKKSDAVSSHSLNTQMCSSDGRSARNARFSDCPVVTRSCAQSHQISESLCVSHTNYDTGSDRSPVGQVGSDCPKSQKIKTEDTDSNSASALSCLQEDLVADRNSGMRVNTTQHSSSVTVVSAEGLKENDSNVHITVAKPEVTRSVADIRNNIPEVGATKVYKDDIHCDRISQVSSQCRPNVLGLRKKSPGLALRYESDDRQSDCMKDRASSEPPCSATNVKKSPLGDLVASAEGSDGMSVAMMNKIVDEIYARKMASENESAKESEISVEGIRAVSLDGQLLPNQSNTGSDPSIPEVCVKASVSDEIKTAIKANSSQPPTTQPTNILPLEKMPDSFDSGSKVGPSRLLREIVPNSVSNMSDERISNQIERASHCFSNDERMLDNSSESNKHSTSKGISDTIGLHSGNFNSEVVTLGDSLTAMPINASNNNIRKSAAADDTNKTVVDGVSLVTSDHYHLEASQTCNAAETAVLCQRSGNSQGEGIMLRCDYYENDYEEETLPTSNLCEELFSYSDALRNMSIGSVDDNMTFTLSPSSSVECGLDADPDDPMAALSGKHDEFVIEVMPNVEDGLSGSDGEGGGTMRRSVSSRKSRPAEVLKQQIQQRIGPEMEQLASCLDQETCRLAQQLPNTSLAEQDIRDSDARSSQRISKYPLTQTESNEASETAPIKQEDNYLESKQIVSKYSTPSIGIDFEQQTQKLGISLHDVEVAYRSSTAGLPLNQLSGVSAQGNRPNTNQSGNVGENIESETVRVQSVAQSPVQQPSLLDNSNILQSHTLVTSSGSRSRKESGNSDQLSLKSLPDVEGTTSTTRSPIQNAGRMSQNMGNSNQNTAGQTQATEGLCKNAGALRPSPPPGELARGMEERTKITELISPGRSTLITDRTHKSPISDNEVADFFSGTSVIEKLEKDRRMKIQNEVNEALRDIKFAIRKNRNMSGMPSTKIPLSITSPTDGDGQPLEASCEPVWVTRNKEPSRDSDSLTKKQSSVSQWQEDMQRMYSDNEISRQSAPPCTNTGVAGKDESDGTVYTGAPSGKETPARTDKPTAAARSCQPRRSDRFSLSHRSLIHGMAYECLPSDDDEDVWRGRAEDSPGTVDRSKSDQRSDRGAIPSKNYGSGSGVSSSNIGACEGQASRGGCSSGGALSRNVGTGGGALSRNGGVGVNPNGSVKGGRLDDDGEGVGYEHRKGYAAVPCEHCGHEDYNTDEETDELLNKQYQLVETSATSSNSPTVSSTSPQPQPSPTPVTADSANKQSEDFKRTSTNKEVYLPDTENRTVLIEGVLFRTRYLGSTRILSDSNPSKAKRMSQAQECVGRIKSPDGESQPSTDVDLFVSAEKIMVLDTDKQEVMMDHSLQTVSYIADIDDLLVIMARQGPVSGSTEGGARTPGEEESEAARQKRLVNIRCHVFQSDEAQIIAQSIGQAFQVAYAEFLKANGIEDANLLKNVDYQEVLNQQQVFGEELSRFSKKEMQKEVLVTKLKGEPMGVVIVESGWGSMVPTVVVANLSPSGAAARCNQLNIGDQIISVNGISMVGLPLSTCQSYIRATRHQTVVKLTVVHCTPVVEVLIRRPDSKYQLGFSVQNGVICSLLRGGIGERGGVRVGHRIIEINGHSMVAIPHERIVHVLASSVGEIHMKTMQTSIYRLLTGQDVPHYI